MGSTISGTKPFGILRMQSSRRRSPTEPSLPGLKSPANTCRSFIWVNRLPRKLAKPELSNFGPFGQRQCIIDIDPKVSDGIFDVGMAVIPIRRQGAHIAACSGVRDNRCGLGIRSHGSPHRADRAMLSGSFARLGHDLKSHGAASFLLDNSRALTKEPALIRSPVLILTRSQPRNLLSIARSNRARLRRRLCWSR